MRKIDRLEIEINDLINRRNDKHNRFVSNVIKGNGLGGNTYNSQKQIKDTILKYKIEISNLNKIKENIVNIKHHDMRKKRVREVVNNIEEIIIMAKTIYN